MKIFEIDLIREKITEKLTNADASNLMTALKPTEDWERFFDDKKRTNRDIYCPLCMFNITVPPIDPFYEHVHGSEWRTPMNNMRYPYPFTIERKIYQEEHEDIWAQSLFVMKQSSNISCHKNRLAITPNSPEISIRKYFEKINFGEIPKFSSEEALLDHIREVSTLKLSTLFQIVSSASLF